MSLPTKAQKPDPCLPRRNIRGRQPKPGCTPAFDAGRRSAHGTDLPRLTDSGTLKRVASAISVIRERSHQLWAVRLLLVGAILGMILGGGMWRGEIHAHHDDPPGHSHGPTTSPAQGNVPSNSADPSSEAEHVHFSATPLLILATASPNVGRVEFPSVWVAPDGAPSRAASPQSTPHRPPIA
jgi:hypothetical protein